MSVGRNDPCPCGSGKKYKKCCLDKAGQPRPIPDLAPVELVQARARAFGRGDFEFIYDSYHPESYFIEQFPDRAAYLRYGQRTLAEDFEILECRILMEKTGGDEARVIFYLDTRFKGTRSESFELSLFLRTPEGWRYHSSQKLSREEYTGQIADIGWDDFEKVKDKVYF
ncbi:UPF0225 protein [Desulfuromonas versatilis]|uniref:UPF0225 protein n=1 Tax=Desulfuromonas versatilis TaxID=2802975 RepID=A0ABM8HXY2_9BACT|nr:YchJ family metal-binding protein [Desulfuromonas versatilis]BCR05385.1 UPF0225 protein [Desulfuromonas versatilis]